jgi:hypothetical protein
MGAELPLPILAGVIGAGIPLLLFLVHLGGGSRHAPLDDRRVRQLLAEEDPSATVDVLHLERDARTALIRAADGRRFVAWAMESSGALREIPASASITRDGDALVVRLADPGWPPRRVHLPPELHAPWLPEADHAA